MPFADPHPYKDAARMAVRNALRRGDLIRPNECNMCKGFCKPQAHHDDYEYPLAVTWLCIPCHSLVHYPNPKRRKLSQKKMKQLIADELP